MKTFWFPLVLSVLLTACRSDVQPPAAMPPTEAAATSPSASISVPEPQFVQEGVLEFRAPDGTKSLLRLHIEIAPNDTEQEQGLMWRKKMAEDQGMLFIFPMQEPRSFWMRNTYIPLDIIYVNSAFEVVSIRKNTPVLNDNPQPSGVPAQYVVEVNGGVSDKYQIEPGTKVAWSNFTTQQSMGGFEVLAL